MLYDYEDELNILKMIEDACWSALIDDCPEYLKPQVRCVQNAVGRERWDLESELNMLEYDDIFREEDFVSYDSEDI